MGMFSALDTSVTGATVSRVWLDAIADNVANVNTVRAADEEPFRARLVIAQSRPGAPGEPGTGVEVEGIALKDGDPTWVYAPDHPLASPEGYIARPVVDMAEEMTNLVIANRTYQANLSVLSQVRDSYRQALQIGDR